MRTRSLHARACVYQTIVIIHTHMRACMMYHVRVQYDIIIIISFSENAVTKTIVILCYYRCDRIVRDRRIRGCI